MDHHMKEVPPETPGTADDQSGKPASKPEGNLTKDLEEGKVSIRCNPAKNIFYNPAQEVNRDVR